MSFVFSGASNGYLETGTCAGAPLRTLDRGSADEAAVCKVQTLLLPGVCLPGRPLVAVSRALAAGWLAAGLGLNRR